VWSSPVPAPAAAVIQIVPTTSMLLPAQPIRSISANSDESRLAQEINTLRLMPPARKTVNMAKAEPVRKHSDSATNAESTRDRDSFAARVEAALANANRMDALGLSPPHANRMRPAIAQPDPTTAPSGAAVVMTAPVQEFAPNPGTAVDVSSSPAAAVRSLPAPPTAQGMGILSTLEQILRHDPLADEAPRPPMPVGQ